MCIRDSLTGSEGLEHMGELLLEQGRRSGIRRGGSIVIGDEVAEMAVLLLSLIHISPH